MGDLESLRRWNKRGTGSAAECHRQLGFALDEIERLRSALDLAIGLGVELGLTDLEIASIKHRAGIKTEPPQ